MMIASDEQMPLFSGEESAVMARKVSGSFTLRSLQHAEAVRFVRPDESAFDMSTYDYSVRGDADDREVRMAKELLADLLENKGGQIRYMATSAMHKEVRRSDVRMIVRWARLIRAIKGASGVKDYLRKIIFEETRNIALLDELQHLGGKDYETVARKMAASRKKQEVEARIQGRSFDHYVSGYVAALENRFKVPTDEQIEDVFDDSSDPAVLFEMFWRTRLSPDESHKELMHTVLTDRAVSLGGWAKTLAEMAHQPGFYTDKCLIELVSGLWSEDANEVDASVSMEVDDELPTIPLPQDYVFDNHTRRGMKVLSKSLMEVAPSARMPAGVDLRWSGLIRGVAWREYAVAQFGVPAYREQPWEAVHVPKDIWDKVHNLDGYFYRKLYRAARVRDVPFPQEEVKELYGES